MLASLGRFRCPPWGATLLALALLAGASPAAAEEDSAVIRGAARFLAEQGDAKLHAGRYEEALELFRMAEQLFHAPTLMLAIAQAEHRLGRWTEARRHYREVIDEKLEPGAPPAFRGAQGIARGELASLEPKIPRLVIEVEPRPAGLELRLDGKPFPAEALTAPIFVDPGKHEVVVIAGDVVRVRTPVLKEGDEETLRIDLREHAPEPSAPEPEPTVAWWWPATAFGLGIAGVAVGSATGILALRDANELKASCSQGTQACDPAAEPLERSASTLAAVSTTGFVVGAVGLVTGATLLIVELSGPAEEVALRLGPGSLGLEGRF